MRGGWRRGALALLGGCATLALAAAAVLLWPRLSSGGSASRRLAAETESWPLPPAAAPPSPSPPPPPPPQTPPPSPPASKQQWAPPAPPVFCEQRPPKDTVRIVELPLPAALHESVRRALPPAAATDAAAREKPLRLLNLVPHDYIPDHVAALQASGPCSLKGRSFECEVRCPVRCSVARGPSSAQGFDAVIVRSTRELSDAARGAAAVLYQSEPQFQTPVNLSDEREMARFDLVASIREGADVFIPAHNDKFRFNAATDARGDDVGPMFCPAAPKTEPALAVFFANQCSSPNRREEYIRELRRFIDVDAYGDCLRNREQRMFAPPAALYGYPLYDRKLAIASRYRFVLAFENANQPDLVTEKVYHALASGAVPVYMGAPNVDEFVPAGSVIKTQDFAGPEQLAAHLRALAADADAYARLQQWRARREWPLSHKMLASKRFQFCAICLALRDLRAARRRHDYRRSVLVWDAATLSWRRRHLD